MALWSVSAVPGLPIPAALADTLPLEPVVEKLYAPGFVGGPCRGHQSLCGSCISHEPVNMLVRSQPGDECGGHAGIRFAAAYRNLAPGILRMQRGVAYDHELVQFDPLHRQAREQGGGGVGMSPGFFRETEDHMGRGFDAPGVQSLNRVYEVLAGMSPVDTAERLVVCALQAEFHTDICAPGECGEVVTNCSVETVWTGPDGDAYDLWVRDKRLVYPAQGVYIRIGVGIGLQVGEKGCEGVPFCVDDPLQLLHG